jgi:hypothetical protein
VRVLSGEILGPTGPNCCTNISSSSVLIVFNKSDQRISYEGSSCRVLVRGKEVLREREFIETIFSRYRSAKCPHLLCVCSPAADRIFRICLDRYDCFDRSGLGLGSLFGSVGRTDRCVC